MTISELTLTVNNPKPTVLNALTDEAGGTFPAGTYSFVVVAWFTTGEGSVDNAGLERGAAALANWEIVLGSGSRKINIDWTAASRVPHHYAVYFQKHGTIDLDAVVFRAATAEGVINIDRNTTSVTLLNPNKSFGTITTPNAGGVTLIDSAATFTTDGVVSGDFAVNITNDDAEGRVSSVDSEIQITNVALTGGTPDNEWGSGDAYEIQTRATFGASATFIVMDLIEGFTPVIRDFTAIGYNAEPIRKSQASNSIVKALDIRINHTSLTQAEFSTVLEWMGNSTFIKIEDGDSNALIQTYFGRFLSTNYLGSWSKNSLTVYDLNFLVSSTSTT